MSIPQHFIQELLARADVVEIVGRHVQLRKTGANFSGLCPFHSEKSPSFTVSPSKQFYHCFGCGKNGNAIGFLMDHTGGGFVEVVHDLAQEYGMPVPEDERSPAERERASQESEKRATLSDVLAKASEAYRTHLRHSPRAIDYLKKRGLSGQVARDFGLGYSPEGWRTLASVFPDYADPLLHESGLVIISEEDETKRYDRFRDRIMFPIRSVKGEVIGFGGRVLGDEKPKYLNSPETPVFHKGRELYGLFEARQAMREEGYALVTEGYMDVVALAQLGFANAVATLGTACTPDHVQKLLRFTDSVVFSFDGDAAGRRAAHKALEATLPFATDTRSIKFLFLPPEHDPDSFIRAQGPEAFAQAVKQAVPLSRFLLEAAAEDLELSTAEGRAHFAAKVKPLWQLLPTGTLGQQILGDIAAQVQLGAQELQALWGMRTPKTPRQDREAHSPYSPDQGPPPGQMQEPRQGQRQAYRPGQWQGDGRGKGRFNKPLGPPTEPRTANGRRTQPASRADRALQIVLTDPAAWEALSATEHQMLCDFPKPHGALFTWLDSQFHDYGPQPWSALREALRGHELEAQAVAQINKMPPEIENDPEELRNILKLEVKARDAVAMQRAAEAGDIDTYQRLMRRNTEKTGQNPPEGS
ncbi:DNA primase [Ottowia thiooxydans]|uniref:DNA primase n=1 Tax=Ottowia thiooxydans TaxID=219182 RepID=A0ABV2Q6J4_9BURK